MTMHIYFEQDKDGHKKGWSGYVERSLARRFCENGIAIPYQTHLDNIYDAEQAVKAAEKKAAKAAKKADQKKKDDLLKAKADKKADQKKKDDLLKAKADKKAETADSKNQKKSEKAVKK